MIGLVETVFLGSDDLFEDISRKIKKIKYRGLDSVREDLQKRGINIEDLVVTDGSLQKVFHPEALYTDISYVREGRDMRDNGLVYFLRRDSKDAINIIGEYPAFFDNKQFDVLICFSWLAGEKKLLREKIETLKTYFHQRMEAQQPQYIYTYRSRKEIK